ncbi:hypothetical protein HanRHA438_Chr09g0419431 [Helianthus annuus]|nr:hypothetical protein HanIR_Chr09g0439221 [Helianthus annuus]KAJ0890045.1 hypothetical protein HanRHA438_Chr09g0419431 [Helianthus annuus]
MNLRWMLMDLDRSSFEVYVDPSTGFRSIDDPSISLSDPSSRRSVLGIYTHVMCSLHFKQARGETHSAENTHTLREFAKQICRH